jgi:CRP/FNR family cyclic AMP-dependent transcriptional regulator
MRRFHMNEASSPTNGELHEGLERHREKAILSELPHEPLQALGRVGHTACYPRGATLFLEGQPASGLFIVCEGQVKLYLSENEGKTITLQVAGAGEVLGVSAAITGQPYAVGAEALRATKARFVKREDLLCLMRQHPEMALSVAQHLSDRYHNACHEMRCVLMIRSVPEKLAKLLLQWVAGNGSGRGLAQFSLSHEEISQLIGTSRESVTRTLSQFRKRNVASLTGGSLKVLDHHALLQIAEPGKRHSRQLKRIA